MTVEQCCLTDVFLLTYRFTYPLIVGVEHLPIPGALIPAACPRQRMTRLRFLVLPRPCPVVVGDPNPWVNSVYHSELFNEHSDLVGTDYSDGPTVIGPLRYITPCPRDCWFVERLTR